MAGRRNCRSSRLNGLNAHQPHEPLNAVAIDGKSLLSPMHSHPPAAIEWRSQVLLIDPRMSVRSSSAAAAGE